MILAGVDEAGLGPTLGPLATAGAALAVPDDWLPSTPWESLGGALCREWRKGEERLVVADSKVVYKRGGMAALEAAAGAFSLLAAGAPRPVLALSGLDAAEAGVHPCYSRALEPFPLHADAAAIRGMAEKIGEAMEAVGTAAAHVEAAVLYEPVLNRRYDSGLNKNQALLVETGWHLRRLAEKFPDQRILAVVDKQGGRNDYLPFLTALFPGAWLETLACGPAASRYRMRRAGGDVEFRFQVKADADSFPTALASMTAKYVRERAVAELNAWFGERLDGLRPTAGYPEDARRWLSEVRGSAAADKLDLELVIRKR